MKYRKIEKNEDKLSVLGYGCMRFPKKNQSIDYEKTEKQIITAIEKGVNYFDTAYLYPKSEETLGKILKSNNCREKVKIATKIPVQTIKTREKMDEIFENQLKRLQTDYIDYYLIHNLIKFEEWENLKNLGILDFINSEKKKGRIINFGFSFHGNLHEFKKIIDDYGWEFCMIQYNYIDEHYQAGTEGLNYAASKNIGVIAMEPLRGGMLVEKLPKKAKKIIENFNVKRSPGEWGLRWVWDNPAIKVVLSGMNDDKIIEENINAASESSPNSLSLKEKQMLEKVKEEFKSKIKVECTNCAYCMPCPQGVDIPTCFSSYNDKSMFGGFKPQVMYVNATEDKSAAYKCTQCGVCEKKCPQEIAIIEELKNVSKSMDKWYYRLLGKIVKLIIYR
ncbi:putative oxidoreductase [Methanobrevibacter arboriphilus JCM 13429 = DSM 1125]|uniref:Putative oxidoreductase n=1 Tax=Methanobrevibacter arboriphilus JCM 13429 = DSM 1125 TaxID=1300164 RepID=A0A1V6N1F3_METAZ|nr:aldo/keto reductase [Methanobrevibacter arboriphilus]OQD58550.1 putative oxidoreductase [Methanobrevibacter arboriphilus JCM 13429 = DSM 1125]